MILKEFSPGFVLKGFAISFGALFLIYAGFFVPEAYNHIRSVEHWIGAEKLGIVPEKYAVVTESEIGKYPALKRALKTEGQNFRVDPTEMETGRRVSSVKRIGRNQS